MRCPLSSLDVATSSEMFLLTTWSLPQNHGYRNEPGKGFYETWFDIYRTRLGTICLFSWPKGGVFLAASAWESLGVKPVKPNRPAPFRYVSNDTSCSARKVYASSMHGRSCSIMHQHHSRQFGRPSNQVNIRWELKTQNFFSSIAKQLTYTVSSQSTGQPLMLVWT